ncbi:ABC transporter permease [Agaribacterium sp. ZY112]|uniref:ABC transporter permease n=1 Tax=Agaribacterium sp. ZY112 TaxID=3233574 RepID=UPI003526A7D6
MNLLGNLYYSLRLFYKNLSTSVIAVLVLAIGLSMALTMFSMANMMMWDTPKFANKGDLVSVDWHRQVQEGDYRNLRGIAIDDYEAMKRDSTIFDELVAFHYLSYAVHRPDGSDNVARYQAGRVSGNFFTMIGQDAILGRIATEDDVTSGEDVVVIGYTLWQNEFEGSDDAIGSTLLLDGTVHTIIGVMPEGFRFPFAQELWKPYDWRWEKDPTQESTFLATIFGTLKEGVSMEQAKADLDAIARQQQTLKPEKNKYHSQVKVQDFSKIIVDDELSAILFILIIGSLFVLLIACANVSNLLLARISKRQFELNMRKVLGAKRREIILQVLMDALVIASVGTFFSFLMAAWAGRYIWTILSDNYSEIPYWWDMSVDLNVFSYGIAIMLFSVLISSLSPLLKIASKYNADALKDNARTTSGMSASKTGKVLVTSQISLTLVLLIIALMFASLTKDQMDRKLPYDEASVLMNTLYISHEAGFEQADSVIAFYDNAERNIRAIPGIKEVSFVHGMNEFELIRDLDVEGRGLSSDKDKIQTNANIVTEAFFQTLGATPLQGRFFNKSDNASSRPVTVVNQAFVDEYFPDGNVLGKRIRVRQPGNNWEPQNRLKDEWTPWLTIVGVTSPVTSTKGYQAAKELGRIAPYVEIYISNRQWVSRVMHVYVTAEGSVATYAPQVNKAIAKLSTKLAPMDVYRTLEDLFEERDLFVVIITNFILSFAFVALLMASAGLYGIASFTAQQKKREYGIHMALGAGPKNIVWLVLKTMRWQLLIGLSIGLALADMLGRLMEQALSNGPVTNVGYDLPVLSFYVFCTALVLAVLALAMLLPAWRSSQMNPNLALNASV